MPWTIVLAGGEGTRLSDESRRRFGYARPKQFCDFDGRGTLLDRTLRRARAISAGSRIVVVTTRKHRAEADRVLEAHPDVVRVEQPANRDTTPGILLPLLHVLDWDPGAPVLLLPADHHVTDEAVFARAARRAVEVVREAPQRIAVLGADPAGALEDYGWLVPAGPGPEAPVGAFREKPGPEELVALCRGGALVNTFVLAARARMLASVLATHAPGWWRTLTSMRLGDALEAAYDVLPSANFSKDILEKIPHLMSIVPLAAEAGWSDIGTPARLARAMPPGRIVPPSPQVVQAAAAVS